jgi:hypothetical protein
VPARPKIRSQVLDKCQFYKSFFVDNGQFGSAKDFDNTPSHHCPSFSLDRMLYVVNYLFSKIRRGAAKVAINLPKLPKRHSSSHAAVCCWRGYSILFIRGSLIEIDGSSRFANSKGRSGYSSSSTRNESSVDGS